MTSDEHAAHVAGYAGDRVIRTPSLDRLARGSLRFDRAAAVAAILRLEAGP